MADTWKCTSARDMIFSFTVALIRLILKIFQLIAMPLSGQCSILSKSQLKVIILPPNNFLVPMVMLGMWSEGVWDCCLASNARACTEDTTYRHILLVSYTYTSSFSYSCIPHYRDFHLFQGIQFYICILAFLCIFLHPPQSGRRSDTLAKIPYFSSRIFSKKTQLRLNPCTHAGCITSVTCVQNNFLQL